MVTRAKSAKERAFTQLSTLVLEGLDIHRCAAAKAVGKIAHPGAGPVLQQALLDEDEDVRTDAAAALLELDETQAAGAIMENLLGDPCPEVKLSAIELLASVNHRPVVPWLHTIVAGREEEINWGDDDCYASGWDDWLDIQLAAIKALGKVGTAKSVTVIMNELKNDEGQDLTQVAIPALAQLKTEGVAALTTLYTEGDARTRRRVCSVLQPGQSVEMDGLLEKCLADNAGEVRYVALEKIIDNDPEDARLAAYFSDNDVDVRILIAKTISSNEPGLAMERLSDKSAKVRETIFRSIAVEPGAFEKEGFSEIVKKAIIGIPEVAGAAAVAWAGMIGKESAKSLGRALQNPEQPLIFRLGLIEALTLLDDAGLPYLLDTIGNSNRQIRISTMSALAEIATSGKWPNTAGDSLLAALRGELVEAVEDVDDTEQETARDVDDVVPEEQSPATSTLDKILRDGVGTEPALKNEPEPEEIKLSEDDKKFLEISKLRAMKKGKVSLDAKVAPHRDVRRFTACLLGDFDFPGVTRALGQALGDDDVELKQSCLESLALIANRRGKLKKRLYPAILKETQHKDRVVRMLGARCLGYIKGKEVEDVLVELCSDGDVHARREAITALGRKKGHVESLLRALDDNYSGVRIAAAQVLANRRSQMDVLVELSLAHDGMHRRDIVAMLKDWNANEAAEKYLNILDDDDNKRAWLVAIEALGDLFSYSENGDIQAAA